MGRVATQKGNQPKDQDDQSRDADIDEREQRTQPLSPSAPGMAAVVPLVQDQVLALGAAIAKRVLRVPRAFRTQDPIRS